MKKLYLIGGPMGVGKTTVCQLLKAQTDRSVFLDGDWCWDMHPFSVTEETKEMVLDNICHLLNNFIHCSTIDTIFFCWVMHRQDIIDQLLSRLDLRRCTPVPVSLLCRETVLAQRLTRDIQQGKRAGDIIAKALDYLPLYDQLDTVKLDTSSLTPETAAQQILLL